MSGFQLLSEPDGNVKNASGAKFVGKQIKMIVTYFVTFVMGLFMLIACGLKWPQFLKMDGNAR